MVLNYVCFKQENQLQKNGEVKVINLLDSKKK